MHIVYDIITGLAAVFFLSTTLIFLHNLRYFKPVVRFGARNDRNGEDKNHPSQLHVEISVLIPARNEEDNLPKLLSSLEEAYPCRMEIIVLDDHSTDRTAEIARVYAKRSRHSFSVYSGQVRPAGWLGKNWACHQLGELASGKYLIFLDADTWVSESFISDLYQCMQRDRLDFATVWPHQIMKSVIEKTVISQVYSTIPLYLPAYYSYSPPRWIPLKSLRQRVRPLFASACGQCMAFESQAYHELGGHASVRDHVVEDVALARNLVRSGRSMRMYHGTERIWCRMYRNSREVFQGFRKNFFAGFGYRYLPFGMAWLLHIMVYLIPPALLLLIIAGQISPWEFTYGTYHDWRFSLTAMVTALPFLQRLGVSHFLKWPRLTGLLHLPGILWFQMLAVVVVLDRMLKKKTYWKGRFF